MKPMNDQKKNASISYGFGVAKIIAGIPVTFIGMTLVFAAYMALRYNNIPYYIAQIILIPILCAGIFLIYSGVTSCRLAGNFRKLSAAMEYKNRESINALAQITGQTLTNLVRDLRKMADKGFFPRAFLDLDRGEFVLERDNAPAPALQDGDVILREKVRLSFMPLLAIPAVWAAYGLIRPYGAWYDLVIAGFVSIAVLVAVYSKNPKVYRIVEQAYKAPPPPEPVPINTGNEALDEFLTLSLNYVDELNRLSLSITDEKMTLPIGELLNITRQIFAFVERQPEKLRQIRQFMNYYLPTTIKLLASYAELSQQPLKGENIREALKKIEESMDGIVETFRRELDSLYLDKAVDISVDIDLMLAMMRGQGFSNDFAGVKNQDKPNG